MLLGPVPMYSLVIGLIPGCWSFLLIVGLPIMQIQGCFFHLEARIMRK